MSVGIAGWGTALATRGLSGSLYAVPASGRLEAARELQRAGIGVHADLIVDAGGTHRGAEPFEIRTVRRSLPDARIDLHLIIDDGASAPTMAVQEAIELAIEVDAARLTVAPHVLAEHRGVLQGSRDRGLIVWSELPLGAEPVVPPEGADGLLVMFITPGTITAADPAALQTVRALAGRVPVGVDGGITPELANACAELGADPIVSGRALLVAPPVRKEAS